MAPLRHLLSLVLALWATAARAADVRVVATLPDLAAVAAEVGGDHVHVTSMALPTQDPHFVDAKPNLALDLSRADALLVAGLGLEVGWLPALLTASRNAKIQRGAPGYVDCSQFVTVLGRPTGPVDRSQGDVHAAGNPHYFYDPRAMARVAVGVGDRLAQVDPAHADAYKARAASFAAEIDAARADAESRLAALRGVPVIEYHRSWQYVADWLGFEVIGDIEPKPGIPPTPSHIAQVVVAARSRGARLILVETFYPHKTAELVADKTGARLVTLRAGTDFAHGQSYLEHLAEWVEALRAAVEDA